MTLVRWDPFRDMRSLGRVLFDERSFQKTWLPAVDIFENEDNLSIRAEIPGMKTEDIKVEVEDGVLTLQGEKKRRDEVEKANSYRVERVYGTFTRRFSLPTAVDASKVAATYKDGVLELVLPKTDDAKPRRIEIQAA
jgi:HSP20 family protein